MVFLTPKPAGNQQQHRLVSHPGGSDLGSLSGGFGGTVADLRPVDGTGALPKPPVPPAVFQWPVTSGKTHENVGTHVETKCDFPEILKTSWLLRRNNCYDMEWKPVWQPGRSAIRTSGMKSDPHQMGKTKFWWRDHITWQELWPNWPFLGSRVKSDPCNKLWVVTYGPHKAVAEVSNHNEPIGRKSGIQLLHFEWSPPWHHIETYLSQILTFFVLKSGEDEKERIILMKSRALRSLDFIRIILSSSPPRPFSWFGIQQWPLWSIWPNWFRLTLVMLDSDAWVSRDA